MNGIGLGSACGPLPVRMLPSPGGVKAESDRPAHPSLLHNVDTDPRNTWEISFVESSGVLEEGGDMTVAVRLTEP